MSDNSKSRGYQESYQRAVIRAEAKKLEKQRQELEEVATGVQKLLREMSKAEGKSEPQNPKKKKQESRSSKSLMDLSCQKMDSGRPGRRKRYSQNNQEHERRHVRGNEFGGYNSPRLPGYTDPEPSQYHQGHPTVRSGVDHQRNQDYYPSIPQWGQVRYRTRNWSPPPSYSEANPHMLHKPLPRPPYLLKLPVGVVPPTEYSSPADSVCGMKGEQDKGQEQRRNHQVQKKLNPSDLVKTISLFNGQWGTAVVLGRQLEKSPEEVVKVAKSRGDIFSLLKDRESTIIELAPKIDLCPEYLSQEGCLSKDSCKKLHVCKYFVQGFCGSGSSCEYGHRWDTNHNNALLSKLYLDIIDKKVLRDIIRKVCKDSGPPLICSFYNGKNGCKYGDRCSALHICNSYVANGGKCSINDCRLSHQILSAQCMRILKRFGISVNESHRDILMLLSSLPNVNCNASGTFTSTKAPTNSDVSSTDTLKKSKESKQGQKVSKDKKSNREDSSSERGSSSDESCQSSISAADSAKGRSTKTKDTKNKPRRRRGKENLENKTKTVRSTEPYGDVTVPEICLYALDDKCTNEKKGCRYLHAKSLFHWQVQRDGTWYNYRIFQSKILETAFRDVTKNTVQVPPLDPEKLEPHAKILINVIGTVSWFADFQTMTVTDCVKSMVLKIRRISTRSAAQLDNPKATVFDWYFIDDNGKWIQYGLVDSLGKQTFVLNITSEEIEKRYVSDPSSAIMTGNSQYTYKLDFSKMTQTNTKTNKVREIRRRPSRLWYQKKNNLDDNAPSAFPSYWSPMATVQTHIMVKLDSSNIDYQDVAGRIRLALPTVSIVKIQRLQNPYLWRLLQYKKMELARRYDDNQMNLQKLFYGADPSKIDKTCKENIDWREGTNVAQSFGKGTYFSNSAAVSRSHCVPDKFGHFHIILAQVIVGNVTRGDPSLTRPPVDPSTSELYDTTVDNTNTPTVFVKYAKDEYYPEYIIEFC